ncbi:MULTISPECIES: hypothetical protein [Clostridium]|uniref:DUF7662 domain-containing protein n=1 Tax=Clostridium ragsdalei P11 TaxID=1353534 RepID=A0A1A6AVL9_9CLOT|nr:MULTISPECIES: hypothetical protein [Clostridium]OBR94129.1 hypothetical protein CLRAG_16690 [Clostridium ragsdalei P11]QXE20971.1 hypothetical protein B5S50_20125 [Clostridium sp. 001]
MGKGNKFLQLENYFKSCSEKNIYLTLNEIEQMLGFPLSPSAYKYVAYWHADNTHTFPNTWINEGYKLESLDLKKKVVSFIKVNDSVKKPQSKIKSIEFQNSKKNINTDFIIKEIKKFHEEISRIKDARYKSWEHCYKFFKENREKRFDENNVFDK